MRSSPALLAALVRLREALDAPALTLEVPDVETARVTRRATVDQLEDYILPRVVQTDAPLLMVVGGSTGAGKSTLVNSIVGEKVTEAGVLRPTTRSPVLVHHPDDGEWFRHDRILPDLARTDHATADPGAVQLVATAAIPVGLAVLDAPDVDSVDAANRYLALQLLAAADLWLFVTSAARYSDQVPWDVLAQAAQRDTAVAVVLDRTQPSALDEVRSHLARMMTSRGLRDSPLFTIEETGLVDGRLPSGQVAAIRSWIGTLASDASVRGSVAERTLRGAVRHCVFRAHEVGDVVEAQIGLTEQLATEARTAFDAAADHARTILTDGSLLSGEVGVRWEAFVSSGRLAVSLDESVGRIRDRLRTSLRGGATDAAQTVSIAVQRAVSATVTHEAGRAATNVVDAWRSTPAGRGVVGSDAALERATPGLQARAETAARDWQVAVFEQVRAEAADRRLSPRVLAVGVGGIAAAVTIAALAADDDTREAVVAARDVPSDLLGADAAARLVTSARDDVARRVGELLQSEVGRFDRALDAAGARPAQLAALRDAARAVADARNDERDR